MAHSRPHALTADSTDNGPVVPQPVLPGPLPSVPAPPEPPAMPPEPPAMPPEPPAMPPESPAMPPEPPAMPPESPAMPPPSPATPTHPPPSPPPPPPPPPATPVAVVSFQTGHTNTVTCVAFSPVSPSLLASGSADNTVMLWHTHTMEQLAVLQGHLSAVTSVAFNRNGTLLASSDGNGRIVVWSVNQRRQLFSIETLPDGLQLEGLSFSNDGSLLSGGTGYAFIIGRRRSGMATGAAGTAVGGGSMGIEQLGDDDAAWFEQYWRQQQEERQQDQQQQQVQQQVQQQQQQQRQREQRRQQQEPGPESEREAAATEQAETQPLQQQFFDQLPRIQGPIGLGDRIRSWVQQVVHGLTLQGQDALARIRRSTVGGISISSSSSSSSGSGRTVEDDGKGTSRDTDSRNSSSASSGSSGTLEPRGGGGGGGSPSRRRALLQASSDNAVVIWNLTNRTQVASLRGHLDQVTSTAFSPTGTQLASGSLDGTILLWDSRSFRQVGALTGQAQVSDVAWAPTGVTLASSSQSSVEKSVDLWDTRFRTLLASLQGQMGHLMAVTGVAYASNGAVVASCSQDRTVRIWDAESYNLLEVLPSAAAFTSVAISNDSSVVAAGSSDRSIRLWGLPQGQVIGALQKQGAQSLCFNPAVDTFAVGLTDNSIQIMDQWTHALDAVLLGHSWPVVSLSFTLDGTMLASADVYSSVRLWNVALGVQLSVINLDVGVQCYSVVLSPDSTTIALGWNSNLVLWDVARWQQIASLSEHTALVRAVAYSPDGTLLATGAQDNNVIVWDASAMAPVALLSGHSQGVAAVAWSPDGSVIASGSYDNTVRLWDVWQQGLIAVLSGHSSAVLSVQFSPDGTLLASCASDGTVRLWSMATLQQVQVLTDHTTFFINEVAFSRQGALLGSAASDNSVNLYGIAPQYNITVSSLPPAQPNDNPSPPSMPTNPPPNPLQPNAPPAPLLSPLFPPFTPWAPQLPSQPPPPDAPVPPPVAPPPSRPSLPPGQPPPPPLPPQLPPLPPGPPPPVYLLRLTITLPSGSNAPAPAVVSNALNDTITSAQQQDQLIGPIQVVPIPSGEVLLAQMVSQSAVDLASNALRKSTRAFILDAALPCASYFTVSGQSGSGTGVLLYQCSTQVSSAQQISVNALCCSPPPGLPPTLPLPPYPPPPSPPPPSPPPPSPPPPYPPPPSPPPPSPPPPSPPPPYPPPLVPLYPPSFPASPSPATPPPVPYPPTPFPPLPPLPSPPQPPPPTQILTLTIIQSNTPSPADVAAYAEALTELLTQAGLEGSIQGNVTAVSLPGSPPETLFSAVIDSQSLADLAASYLIGNLKYFMYSSGLPCGSTLIVSAGTSAPKPFSCQSLSSDLTFMCCSPPPPPPRPPRPPVPPAGMPAAPPSELPTYPPTVSSTYPSPFPALPTYPPPQSPLPDTAGDAGDAGRQAL